jgi:MerR family transcriptional regulator, mercuric resistance operon regulatory protein
MVGPLSIGQLAAAVGVQVSTIRFYERSGLLASPSRSKGGHRQYGTGDVQRVRFIRNARELGFSVDQVRGVDSIIAGDPNECELARQFAEKRLVRIQREIADLKRKEELLSRLIARCGEGRGVPCPILAELRGMPA